MSSPWGKIEQPEAIEFHNIMSEEYARELQDKENRKFAQRISKQFTTNVLCEDIAAGPSGSDKCEMATEIPVEVLNAIKNDMPYQLDDFCDSDKLIAELLQEQYDHDRDCEIRRIEKHKNKDSKVSVSYCKYRTAGMDELIDSDEDREEPADPKHWDRFETNEKRLDNLPKKGYGLDEDGIMITKHDEKLCGVRNACRVMSFPPEFKTGDAAGFDMKLPNSVFNQLKIHSQKTKKTKANDRRENIATAEVSVDDKTRVLLYKLVNNQVLEQINGIVSTGKEAVILHALSDGNYTGALTLPKECAIKIFKTASNGFKQRDNYIKGDYRFKDRMSKQNNRTAINMWAEKEMHNLMRMQKHGINCPDVVLLKKNILVMSFIGEDNVAAPKLKEAGLSYDELELAYDEILSMMNKLYNEANLVHADLSEYNILWHKGKPWFIDVAQSVEPEHPSAKEFMMRDCNNISTFFTRKGLHNVKTKEELFSSITGLDSFAHNAAMLERIYDKGPSVVMATAPTTEDMPEILKPLTFPFDYAWDKTQEKKLAPPASDNVSEGENKSSLEVV
ncbi:Serine/threonine-protein kinase RIO3 [Pseudolycoriella hygida]|uniref:Serine/threonine-protein kinase RIO3 n=1 Tax=Pseudolycoriella hygida TaxID=35572 RepID=A0A9Q0MR52_9DIPT|nr:Serine/threonine-protein kinase RIO3 [Pseudolycoriella hygida]